MTTTNEEDNICIHIECDEHKLLGGWKYCQYHIDGGELGNGETYDQYQIIEQDFIDFIKVVPINDSAHFKVHSPILRDIIIRCCVQIELFFKEWSKYSCSENTDSALYREYNEIDNKTKLPKGERNWTIGSYYFFINEFTEYKKVFVRPINKSISPFETWESEKKPPIWWKAYNSIKHNGITSKKDANLENALYSLAALFQLHCINRYSRSFLKQYKNTSISPFVDNVKLKFHSISSPIDSKRYLFKEDIFIDREIEIVTMQNFKNRNKKTL